MEDKFNELIESLIAFTTNAKIKWTEGSEEGEYYLNIDGRGFLVSSHSGEIQEYTLDLLNEEGKSIMSMQIAPSDGKLYESARKLYNLASTSNERAGQTIEELINFIKSKNSSEGSLDSK